MFESDESEKLEFQIYDWNSYHEIDDNNEETYIIQLFGRTEDDKDVCLKITGFTPFFYVEIPMNWTQKQIDFFIESLKKKVSYTSSKNPKYDYDLSKSLIRHKVVYKYKFFNFNNKTIFKFVMLIFKSKTGMMEFSNVLSRPFKSFGMFDKATTYQRYESNIEPHIRFMHINNLSSCGWVYIEKSKLKEINEYSYCDLTYSVFWKDIKPAENDNRMAPFKIMGYDIECVSCDENFPQATRITDKIIQIGITMYRYGSMNCYDQHILTLKKCAKIKNANVECYKTEKGLIKGFAKKIRELRPDFKVGYNNFGFDDKYIYDRINKLEQEEAKKKKIDIISLPNKLSNEFFEIMGKLNNKYLMENENLKSSLTFFEIKNLSSSAMGDNEFKFIQIPGIISIDMMKVIQRSYNLTSWKLDSVSANFITESIEKVVTKYKTDNEVNILIYTKSTKALEKNAYIQIMIDDGYASSAFTENKKYKVLDITTITENKINYQCIEICTSEKESNELEDIITKKTFKVYWTFAKDDIHHTMINKYFNEQDPKKVRIIAKYCLKDCKLVNLLLAKLEIIVNSIGMAKVCHVPLSYLFLRGQGIKIFSLVSKKCQQKKYLIPVIQKNKNDITGDEEESYEGATVINPKPGVYLSPIAVLDFNSLYPNSMREDNLTHECYVNDSKYDNLEGYIYHNIYIVIKDKKGKIIRNIDGTPRTKINRFAQEIVTEEQMNEEMKDIINIINNESEKSLKDIDENIYFTEEYCKYFINNQDKLVEENYDKSDELKEKIQSLSKLLEEINKEKKNSEIKIKELMDNNELSNDEKDKLLELEKLKSKNINKIKLTKWDKDKLKINVKNIAQKKILDEKTKRYNFSQGKYVRYGILPEILTELLNERKATNNKLANEKDPFIKSILNALQLAYKITANSLYGQTGASTSPLFFVEIAASTTAIGRERLNEAKRIVENNFEGSEIVYGDSITSDTPLVIKNNNNEISIIEIGKLSEKWIPYSQFKLDDYNCTDKQQSIVNYEIMTTNGWKKIKRVIRHKTIKKIYRITTDHGSVDVTEDHSLIDKNMLLKKPMECKIGTELLHCKLNFIDYDLSKYYKHHFDDEQSLKTYLDHLIKKNILIFTKALDAQIIYCLFKKYNKNLKIRTYMDKYILLNDNIIISDNIINIEYLRKCNNEYVYDIETGDGTFHAGVGELIVKNTDSIFIDFHLNDNNKLTDKENLIKTIENAKKAATLINKNIPKPQTIVYEKTYYPFILIAKKKYVGMLYVDDPNVCSLKAMGIVLKRRDNAPIVKIVVGGIIDHILKHQNIDTAIKYTKDVIIKLMDGKYSIDKFIISKTLKAKYKKPSTIAHKVLADRMAIRDPGNKPQINDRISYVYIVKDFGKKKKKDILQGDLVENPDFVIENKLQIDYLYYLEHQIMNPATQILELMIPTSEVEKFFNRFIIKEQNKRKKRQSMEKWMDGYVVEEEEVKKNTKKIMETIIPKYVGKKHKLENQSMEKWMNGYIVKDEINKPKITNKVIPIYARKKIELDKQCLDKWLYNDSL